MSTTPTDPASLASDAEVPTKMQEEIEKTLEEFNKAFPDPAKAPTDAVLRERLEQMKAKIIDRGAYKPTDFQLIDSLMNEFEAVGEVEKLRETLAARDVEMHALRDRVAELTDTSCEVPIHHLDMIQRLKASQQELVAENTRLADQVEKLSDGLQALNSMQLGKSPRKGFFEEVTNIREFVYFLLGGEPWKDECWSFDTWSKSVASVLGFKWPASLKNTVANDGE